MTSCASRPDLRALLALLVAALCLLGPGRARPVAADDAEGDDGRGRYLHVDSDPSPASFPDLRPGDTVVWSLGITADPPDIGEITRTLRTAGPLAEVPGALTLTVHACDRRPRDGRCPGPTRLLLEETALDELVSREGDLGSQLTDEQAWLLVTARVASDIDAAAQGKRAQVVFAATGESDAPVGSGPGRLARTGAGLAAAVVLALSTIAAGLLLAVLARHRSEVSS